MGWFGLLLVASSATGGNTVGGGSFLENISTGGIAGVGGTLISGAWYRGAGN